jgi:hypothetical protein
MMRSRVAVLAPWNLGMQWNEADLQIERERKRLLPPWRYVIYTRTTDDQYLRNNCPRRLKVRQPRREIYGEWSSNSKISGLPLVEEVRWRAGWLSLSKIWKSVIKYYYSGEVRGCACVR